MAHEQLTLGAERKGLRFLEILCHARTLLTRAASFKSQQLPPLEERYSVEEEERYSVQQSELPGHVGR